MSEGNVYKPRYKLAFQAKSKIWPYKNSRLRRFFNIRGRKLVRRGLFKRYVLVLNNMKWTIARDISVLLCIVEMQFAVVIKIFFILNNNYAFFMEK